MRKPQYFRIIENIEKRFRESIARIPDRISKYSSSEWNVVFYHDYHVRSNNVGNIFHNQLPFRGSPLGFFFYSEDLCSYPLDENVYKSFLLKSSYIRQIPVVVMITYFFNK